MEEPVRVRITQQLACPSQGCGRIAYRAWVRTGELWLRCDLKRDWHWWLNITLPAGSTKYTLISTVGVPVTRALLVGAEWEQKMGVELSPWVTLGREAPADPVHVQIPVRGHDMIRLRYASLTDVLRTLNLL
jgi:hypothetical protein